MSTIKNIFHKIEIHKSCYIIIILSILSANFLFIIITSYLLLIHECGHFFTATFFKWSTEKIHFYPFGGISKFSHDLNCPLKEELIVLLMGPIMQILAYFLIIKIPYFYNYHFLITMIHYNILLFNLLPIYSLDGGRILQCLICYLTSYNLSFKLIYLISYLTLSIFIIFFIYNPSLNLLIIIILLLIKLLLEYKNVKYYLERFILERYLHKYHFKKSKIVRNEHLFKRDYHHLIKDNNKYLLEEEYLNNKYKSKT